MIAGIEAIIGTGKMIATGAMIVIDEEIATGPGVRISVCLTRGSIEANDLRVDHAWRRSGLWTPAGRTF